MEIINNIYFYTTVILTLNICYSNGQESNTNVNTTTLPASRKPFSKYPYQADRFNASSITSGPILIIDKKYIFVSGLHYDPSSSDTYFWAGTGSPSSSGSLVLDENDSESPLASYSGQNIYLRLPGNLTTDKIDYLGVWSSKDGIDVGHVMLYPSDGEEIRRGIPEALGYHRVTQDDKIIFRVPKCCAIDQTYIEKCVPSETETIIHFDMVLASNETHIDPDGRIKNMEFMPYAAGLTCLPGYTQVILATDGSDNSIFLGMIFNTSLVYADTEEQGLKSPSDFCIENMNGNKTSVVLCLEDSITTTANMPNLYFPFLIISTVCFFLTAICYIVILKPQDVHKQCFIGYSSSMTLTFLCLIFLQRLNKGCNFIGGLFFLFMLCSTIWFTCLCIDLVFVVKSFKKISDSRRVYYYTGASLVIPLIFLMSSLIPTGIPDVPRSFVKQYSEELRANMCNFEHTNKALFFTPIGLLILTSLAALCYSSYIINTNNSKDYDWLHKKDNFKFMLRSCALIWTTAAVVWLVDLLNNVVFMVVGINFAFDLIQASQGLFVLFVFVLNKYTRKEILRYLKKEKRKREDNTRYASLLKSLNKDNCAAVDDDGENTHVNGNHGESEIVENNHRERPNHCERPE